MTTEQIETKYPGSDTYFSKYECTNCGWSGSIRFKKGNFAPATTGCPKCLCNSAKKNVPRKSPAPMMKDPVLIPIIPGAWPKNPTPCPRTHEPWVDPYWPRDPWGKPQRFLCDTRVDNGEERSTRTDGPVLWDYD